MASSELTFTGGSGAQLAGVLHTPDEEQPRGSVLLAHCFTCSKDLQTMTRLAGGLEEAGYAVLRFDFTGLGDSGGEHATTSVSRDVRDLVAATTALIDRGFGPCGLLGHSMGGAAALLAAGRLHTVRSVAVLGAPSTPSHITHLLGDSTPERDEVAVTIAGRSFTLARSFFDDLDRHDQDAAVADLGRPLLVLHPTEDRTVDIGEGERIFAQASQPKGFLPLVGADHLLTDRAQAAKALGLVRAWFDATL